MNKNHKNHEEHKHKLISKRKIRLLIARTLDTMGWLSLMYFWWVEGNIIGIVISLILMIAGYTLEILAD